MLPRRIFSAEMLISAVFIALIAFSYAAIRNYADEVRIDYADVVKKAENLSKRPYKPVSSEVPPFLQKLTYDQYRDIRFDRSKALWSDLNLSFQIQFLHPGFIFNKTITLYETESRQTHRIGFSSSLFNYGKNVFTEKIPEMMGYSGFRIHYPINRQDYADEVAVFQGASYFRAVGKNQNYGLSARGLAINSGVDGITEEFPVFEEFWLKKPKAGATELTLYALLNSPSVTGAYEFIIRPDDVTQMDVRSTLFFRKDPGVIGIAPLTSMFWYGENSGTTYGDFRPEVHDSDGVLIQTGVGEWLWRPLAASATRTRFSSFEATNPKGFGLMQRDQNFDHYLDLEAMYHNRPSAWIEPLNEWGKGEVRLIEFAASDEINDTVVTFWKPEKNPKKGDKLEFAYRINWCGRQNKWPPNGRAMSTRIGVKAKESKERIIIIDFDSKQLTSLDASEPVEAVTSVEGGAILSEEVVQKNPIDKSWRVSLKLQIQDKNKPIELRSFLKKGNDILTETWSYLISP